jgi:hypothetical protein
VQRSLAAAVTIAAVVAGCAGDKRAEPSPSTTATPTTVRTTRSPLVRALIDDYERLGVDVRAMRAEALKVHRGTLLGTPALRRATARFIETSRRRTSHQRRGTG